MIHHFTAEDVKRTLIRLAFHRENCNQVRMVNFNQRCQIVVMGSDDVLFSVELSELPENVYHISEAKR